MLELADFVNDVELGQLIETARREDLGPTGIDATSMLFIDEAATCRARVVSRRAGVVAGAGDAAAGGRGVRPGGDAERAGGGRHQGGAGPAGGGAGGVAAVGAGAGAGGVEPPGPSVGGRDAHPGLLRTGSRIPGRRVYDTRKTLPGLRGLQKYAVACGGGGTHRLGLYDAVLVKDNHLAQLPLTQWSTALTQMARRAREEVPGLKFIMVEVDTLEQLDAVLETAARSPAPTDAPGEEPAAAGIDLVLLDNMSLAQLREAVRRRDAAGSIHHQDQSSKQLAPQLEASGGVTLETVRDIAETGVDRISVGALTHSSPSLDLGLDMELDLVVDPDVEP